MKANTTETRERSEPAELTRLEPDDPEHPGLRDREYRRRRADIARIALDYRSGNPLPEVEYTAVEQSVWRRVWRRLAPLHRELACGEIEALQRELALDAGPIPQLGVISRLLEPRTGFRMEPVAGLVGAHDFLARLGHGVFLATQYVRHPARPLYTPEPDVVHELVGHAASLMHPRVAQISRLFGRAAAGASDAWLRRLERVYWYTLEFGLAHERGRPRAFGAGLLSSCGELAQFRSEARIVPWNIERMAATPYDPTCMQPLLFAASSFEGSLEELAGWLRAEAEAR